MDMTRLTYAQLRDRINEALNEAVVIVDDDQKEMLEEAILEMCRDNYDDFSDIERQLKQMQTPPKAIQHLFGVLGELANACNEAAHSFDFGVIDRLVRSRANVQEVLHGLFGDGPNGRWLS